MSGPLKGAFAKRYESGTVRVAGADNCAKARSFSSPTWE
jgi:hypothetical protein